MCSFFILELRDVHSGHTSVDVENDPYHLFCLAFFTGSDDVCKKPLIQSIVIGVAT